MFAAKPILLPTLPSGHALQISYANSIYAYGAYFIAVCKELNCPFLSLDNSLCEIASSEDITIIEV